MSSPSHDTCRVCASAAPHVFTQPLLDRPVDYFECARCGYLQTQTPDWLEAAYASAINDVDTGIMLRNQSNVGRVLVTLAACGRLRGRVVDHAGGYGILVRLLRDAGVDARWRDKYCENLVARGFEADDGPYDLLTAFEVFEHLTDPLAELAAMLQQAPVVLLSTELIATAQTPPRDWWYLGRGHGQHIGFCRATTLRWMAAKLGCHHASDGRAVHLFSVRRVPRMWRIWLRGHRLAPLAARWVLTSKTNSDFDMLSRSSGDAA